MIFYAKENTKKEDTIPLVSKQKGANQKQELKGKKDEDISSNNTKIEGIFTNKSNNIDEEEQSKDFKKTLASFFAEEQKFYQAVKNATESVGGNYNITLKEFINLMQKYPSQFPYAYNFPSRFSLQRYNTDLEGEEVIEVEGLDGKAVLLSNEGNLYSFHDKKLDELTTHALPIFSDAYKEALTRVLEKLKLPGNNIFTHPLENLSLFDILLTPDSQKILEDHFDAESIKNLYVVFYTVESMKKGTNAEKASIQSLHEDYKQQILNKNLSSQLIESVHPSTMQNIEAPLKSLFLLNFAAMSKEAVSEEVQKFLESGFFTSFHNFASRELPIVLVSQGNYSGVRETHSATVPYFNNVLHCSSSLIDFPKESEKSIKLIILFFSAVIKEMDKIIKEEIHWRFISKDPQNPFFNSAQTIYGKDDLTKVLDISDGIIDIEEMRTLINFINYNVIHHILKDIVLQMNQYVQSKFIPQEDVIALTSKKMNEMGDWTQKLQESINQTA
jgi:hypothetical protein